MDSMPPSLLWPILELAGPFRMTQPAISQHLKVLEDAGLVTSRVEGTKRQSPWPLLWRDAPEWPAWSPAGSAISDGLLTEISWFVAALSIQSSRTVIPWRTRRGILPKRTDLFDAASSDHPLQPPIARFHSSLHTCRKHGRSCLRIR